MKKLTLFVAALLVVAGVSPAQAEQAVTVAVIDSGFDSSKFGDSIVAEVCITAGAGCNNRTGFEIGQGASGSTVPVNRRSLSDWEHGDFMVSTILSANPNAKILLIRNAKRYGSALLPGNENDLAKALSWVEGNASKYNIVAVSVSRGSHKYVSSNKEVSRLSNLVSNFKLMIGRLKAINGNPRLVAALEKRLNVHENSLRSLGTIECPANDELKDIISNLQKSNVATIIATGNDASRTYVDYPACIDDAVSVSAYREYGVVAPFANVSSNTDFVARAGSTSEATATLAGIWSRMYNGEYTSTYEALVNSGTRSENLSAVFVP
jgi:hypothetical protein